METLKKLAAECWALAPHMQSVAKCTELENVAAKLDAYIKAQESAEPVAEVVNTFSAGHTTRWIGEGKRPPLGTLLYAARPTGPDVPKLLIQKTEAEWREEFDKWWEVQDGVQSISNYGLWLAALRLVGAIKEDGK